MLSVHNCHHVGFQMKLQRLSAARPCLQFEYMGGYPYRRICCNTYNKIICNSITRSHGESRGCASWRIGLANDHTSPLEPRSRWYDHGAKEQKLWNASRIMGLRGVPWGIGAYSLSNGQPDGVARNGQWSGTDLSIWHTSIEPCTGIGNELPLVHT